MKRLALLLLFLVPFSAVAQKKQGQALLDSLLAELPRSKDDTNKAALLGEISYGYGHISPDEGIRYARQEMKLSEQLGWKKGIGLAHNDFGGHYLNKSDYAEAMEHFVQALRIFEELNDQDRTGASLGNIGLIFIQQQNLPKALEYMLRQLRIVESQHDSKRLPGVLGNIARVYREMKQPDKALEYFGRALRLDEAAGNKQNIMMTQGSIGNIYFDLKAYARALYHYRLALQHAREIGARQLAADNLGRIGRTHLYIARDTAANSNTASRADRRRSLDSSIQYCEAGLSLARTINFTGGIKTMSETLAESYALRGQYKEAYEAFRRFSSLKDSIYSTESSARIHELETKRELELKEKDLRIARLAVAKKRNERGFFISGIVLLLGIVGILFYYFRKQQESNRLLSREKKRSDDLLLNILPAEVAEELKETGEAHARQYNNVSVMFTDFVNFTRLAEELTPAMLVKELNECFTAFDAIIARNGLEKIKTIGDAYMAVCGLPASDPEHARKTVLAAMEIRDFISIRSGRDTAFEIRIGINSGPVVAGIVGVRKFAYDIWGDTVNTAARMEQCSETGRINVSGATYELTRDAFVFTPRGKIAAKHKGEVEMYFAESPRSVRHPRPAVGA